MGEIAGDVDGERGQMQRVSKGVPGWLVFTEGWAAGGLRASAGLVLKGLGRLVTRRPSEPRPRRR